MEGPENYGVYSRVVASSRAAMQKSKSSAMHFDYLNYYKSLNFNWKNFLVNIYG